MARALTEPDKPETFTFLGFVLICGKSRCTALGFLGHRIEPYAA